MNTKSFQEIAAEIGRLVTEKDQAYGSAVAKCGDVLRVLYPTGVKPEHLGDFGAVMRIVDKLFRIATAPGAFGEDPWRDISGYALVKATELANRVASTQPSSVGSATMWQCRCGVLNVAAEETCFHCGSRRLLPEHYTPAKVALWCPFCGAPHEDDGEWGTKPHREHLCSNQKCVKKWSIEPRVSGIVQGADVNPQRAPSYWAPWLTRIRSAATGKAVMPGDDLLALDLEPLTLMVEAMARGRTPTAASELDEARHHIIVALDGLLPSGWLDVLSNATIGELCRLLVASVSKVASDLEAEVGESKFRLRMDELLDENRRLREQLDTAERLKDEADVREAKIRGDPAWYRISTAVNGYFDVEVDLRSVTAEPKVLANAVERMRTALEKWKKLANEREGDFPPARLRQAEQAVAAMRAAMEAEDAVRAHSNTPHEDTHREKCPGCVEKDALVEKRDALWAEAMKSSAGAGWLSPEQGAHLQGKLNVAAARAVDALAKLPMNEYLRGESAAVVRAAIHAELDPAHVSALGRLQRDLQVAEGRAERSRGEADELRAMLLCGKCGNAFNPGGVVVATARGFVHSVCP